MEENKQVALNSGLIDAVISNDPAEVKLLLEQGAQANCYEDEAQIRPLHFAALYEAVDVVPLLVMSGGDLSVMTDSHDTPMDIAKRQGNKEMVTLMNKYIHLADDASKH